ncbi:hypothetical protein [Dyadobacter soli]|nr:hypothetical protein [Dyadobacter soli]
MIFSKTENEILSDDKLNKVLKSLFSIYLEKGMILDKIADESVIDWDESRGLELISFDELTKKWVIVPNYFFAYTVLNGTIPDLRSKVPSSVEQLVELFESVTELSDEKGRTGITLLADRIMELLLALIHETSGETFSDWIPRLDSERISKINLEFLQAYCKVADTLPLCASDIANACHHFFSWNDLIIWPNVNPLIERVVGQDFKEAERLILDLPAEFRIMRTLFLSGLIKHDPERAWLLVRSEIELVDNQSYILGAIHHFEFSEQSRAFEALRLVKKCNLGIEVTRHHVPYAVTRLVARLGFEDVTFVDECFQVLKDIVPSADLPTAKQVLLSLSASVEKYPSQTIDLAGDLLKNPNITYEYLADQKSLISFDALLEEVSDLNIVFDFFQNFALCYPFKFDRDLFQETMYQIQSSTESIDGLCKKLIHLIVHDVGEVRYLGVEMLSCFKNQPFRDQFYQNLAELDPISQYKLWMSILSLEASPKTSLVWLLPLLHAKNEVVAEALLCKLEELTESYHEEVITVVERYSEENAGILMTAVVRLKTHYASFCAMLDIKNNIIEFHPSICQPQYYDRFRELHRHRMNEQINNSLNNRQGILSFAKKVVLVKGGGWKHRERDEVTKLGRFQSSYTWPRLHLLNPERFDLERKLALAANWQSDKTDFDEWITV